MPPHELQRYAFVPGQIILGKLARRFLGRLDDRPLVTIAGAWAGQYVSVLYRNLYFCAGSMVVLGPTGNCHGRRAYASPVQGSFQKDEYVQRRASNTVGFSAFSLSGTSWMISVATAVVSTRSCLECIGPINLVHPPKIWARFQKRCFFGFIGVVWIL
jgi:hypothetical protein